MASDSVNIFCLLKIPTFENQLRNSKHFTKIRQKDYGGAVNHTDSKGIVLYSDLKKGLELLLSFSYLEMTTFCFWSFNHLLSTEYYRCLPSSSATRDAPLAAELSRATALRRRIVKQVSSAPHGPVDLGSCHAPAPAYPAPQLLPVLSTVARWPNFGHVTEKEPLKL